MPTTQSSATRRLRVLVLNWRDTGHPEAGGSEVYAESVADGLAQRGHEVTLLTARHEGAPERTIRPSGARVLRRGGRLSVYAYAALAHLRRETGRPEVILETQNGVPYLARLWAPRTAHVVLVHHVHREQWPVVFGPTMARVGWAIESRVAPWVNRRRPYVAVSEVTRTELQAQGIDSERVTVIHNGTIRPPARDVARTEHPSLLVIGRLVPHKRVEIALRSLAALLPQFPDLRLTIAGRGWWEDEVQAEIARLGLTDQVDFRGFVSDEERHELYASHWISLVPSLKEGWGLVVVEAGLHQTPTIAFESAGGVAESIVDGSTGRLAHADDEADFTRLVAELLTDAPRRRSLGQAAAQFASTFTWDATVDAYERLFLQALGASAPARRSVRVGTEQAHLEP
ncbi:MAG TPA: glycosyltransferase family 4 protein [Phycicoccus sp.]|nr:glycosyltransferase family 4 protein [Phycicoccus sp.]HRA44492.1 glycosyltransferase family 4 protein [Phycicoccus sp.]